MSRGLNNVCVSHGLGGEVMAAGAVDKNRIKPLSVFGAYRLVLRPVGALT